eukprot:2183796-Rhodomonas_salina.1
MAPPGRKTVSLNPQHSHLFLIEGKDQFGEEIQARGEFEKCVFGSNAHAAERSDPGSAENAPSAGGAARRQSHEHMYKKKEWLA